MTDTSSETLAYPFTRQCPFRPPAEYDRLRAERPVHRAVLPSGRPVWLVTSHELACRILTDPRISSDRSHPGFPLQFRDVSTTAQRKLPKFSISLIGRSMIGLDPPQHTAHKRLVANEFTVKRIQTLRPRVQKIVDDRVDAMLAGPRPVDLVQALALPVPSQVICELLGVPVADREFFEERTKVLVDRNSSLEQRQHANGEIMDKLDVVITAKEREPSDDLLGRVIVRNRETPTLGHDELLGLAGLLLISGFETTANTISLGTVGLLEHPDQLAALVADPGLAPKAADELLRYFSVSDPAGSRVALADIEIGGEVIKAGEGVIAVASSANRDETAFDRPDELDINRDSRHHLAFGYGVHLCLGQNLARLELEIVFGTLFRRIPGLRVTVPVEDLPYKDDRNIYGLHELPVTW